MASDLLILIFGLFVLLFLLGAAAILILPRESQRWATILSRCEEGRMAILDAAPDDIWHAKKIHGAETNEADLRNSYNALMESTVKVVRVVNLFAIYLTREQRIALQAMVNELHEAASDANRCMNFSNLMADGEARVGNLRQANANVRAALHDALEAIILEDTDHRYALLRRSRRNGKSS